MPTLEEVINCYVEHHVKAHIVRHMEQLRDEFAQSHTHQPILLRVSDLVHLLNVSRTQVYEMLYRGDVPSFKLGKSRMIRYRDVQAFIERKWDEEQRDAEESRRRSCVPSC